MLQNNKASMNRQTKPLAQKNIVSQNNRPLSHDILNKRRNMLARNRRRIIPNTERFNIKHNYDNAIPVSNTSTHPNLMNDNQHDKPTLKNVSRTKYGCIVKKSKQYIHEM